ncbi:hypothetical protein JCM11251_001748 [Rhodosporidiobolus azoricus]
MFLQLASVIETHKAFLMHTAFLLGVLTATSALAAPKYKWMNEPKQRYKSQNKQWATPAHYNLTDIPGTPTVHAPKKNVWKELSHDEAESVVQFLHKQPELNLTVGEEAGAWDNTIGVIDLAVANKSETLTYLSGETGAPDRYAMATLYFSATEEPYIEDYLIGPLPVSNETTAVPYHFRTTTGSSRIRNFDADQDATYDMQTAAAEEVNDIVLDLLGKNASSYSLWGIDPLWHEDGKVISWSQFWGEPDTIFDGQTLLPQGLYMRFDITGRDPSKWGLTGWLYNNVFYGSTAEFRAAWEAGEIEKATRNVEVTGEGDPSWIGTDRVGKDLPFENRPPPMLIAPGGQRFAVDEKEQYVTWGDFSFYWSHRRDMGIRLWDIKYKGDTILHELGLNEALAHYSGVDPVQSGTSYLDTFYGFGPYTYELVSGFDYAKYVNSTYHSREVTTTNKRSICFFETDTAKPVSRHTNREYVAVTKGIEFVMRTVNTIGNYDYTFTYTFALDGSIFVEVSASGYIQSAFYAHNADHGYHIHDGLSGSSHSHVLNFKLDFDINGQANTVGFHSLEPAEIKYNWSNSTRKTFKMVRSELQNEDDASLNWAHNGQTMVLVYNKDEKNKFGEDRAYRVMPSHGAGVHTVMQESSNLGESMSFARHQIYFTKHKDSEFSSSHPMTAHDAHHPIVDFGKYLNGENLVQEDLVMWANLGMHHVPHTGDLPNTVQTTARSSLVIAPHNYLLSDPSRQSVQQVRIDYNSSAQDIVSDVVAFGAQKASGLFNLTAIQPDYYSYVNIAEDRKLPYKKNPGAYEVGVEST